MDIFALTLNQVMAKTTITDSSHKRGKEVEKNESRFDGGGSAKDIVEIFAPFVWQCHLSADV